MYLLMLRNNHFFVQVQLIPYRLPEFNLHTYYTTTFNKRLIGHLSKLCEL